MLRSGKKATLKIINKTSKLHATSKTHMRLKHLRQLKEITNLYKVVLLFERYFHTYIYAHTYMYKLKSHFGLQNGNLTSKQHTHNNYECYMKYITFEKP